MKIQLEEQHRLFELMLNNEKAELLESVVKFSQDRQTLDAMITNEPNALLTSVISLSELLVADDLFVVSANEALFVDAVGTAPAEFGGRTDLQLGLALSNTASAGLSVDLGGSVGISLAAPIYRTTSELLGVVVAYVPLTRAWLANLKQISGFDFTVQTNQGRSGLSTWVPHGADVPIFELTSRPDQPLTARVDGVGHVGLELPLPGAIAEEQGKIVVSRSSSDLEAAVTRINERSTEVAIVSLFLVLGTSLLFTRRITRGLTRLERSAREIGAGNFTSKPGNYPRDEFGQLAGAFQDMGKRLEEMAALREKDQERLLRNERLTVLGQLAGTVSHEIRNPLGVIKNSVYYLRLTQKLKDPKADEHLDLIDCEIENADRIAGELLDYASQSPPDLHLVPIQDMLTQMLTRERVPDIVRLELRLDPHPLVVQADSQQLERAFANITRNAIQAMPKGGILTIGCHKQDGDIVATIEDTGIGIPAETLGEIFEPLFSNKARGAGLGLSLSKRYIERSGGWIRCSSRIGSGTVFEIGFPSAERSTTDDSR